MIEKLFSSESKTNKKIKKIFKKKIKKNILVFGTLLSDMNLDPYYINGAFCLA